MATKAKGLAKQVIIKKETTFGELAGTSGGKTLRRVSAEFNSQRPNYESAEIRTSQQVSDVRLGTRSTTGSLSGELSPGSYSELIQAIVAKDFTAGTAQTSVGITSITLSNGLHTLTRTTGDWTAAFKVGDVVRISVSGDANTQQGINLLVVSVAALPMVVKVLADVTFGTGAIVGCTVTPIGKSTYVPTSGHTDQSFTVEEFYSDVSVSEVHAGVKVASFGISVPASGMVTTDFSFTGKGLAQTGSSQYFVSPTAQSTTGVVAAVNGAVLINGSATTACVTDFSLNVERALEASQCIGKNSAEAIFSGIIRTSGSFSLYFEDSTVANLFEQETNVTLVLAVATGSDKTAGVLSFVVPKSKITSFNKTDNELAITASVDFMGLEASASAGIEATTLRITDTAA